MIVNNPQCLFNKNGVYNKKYISNNIYIYLIAAKDTKLLCFF
jgi:hypothetical protein